MQKASLEEIIEHAVADALRPYASNSSIHNGPNAHLWIARRVTPEVVTAVRKHLVP